ncbi:MAG TPA: DUF58 domain-containing protein [Chloroflexota bacterium]|nr:DUF58 domain-containing protein [Chloroflexota bacterium]
MIDGAFLERLERLSLVSRRRLVGFGKGDRRSIHKGTSIEFVDYRHYAPGDDPRQVDWNIYRRSGSLYVKQFEEEEVLTAHVLVDVSASMDWGSPSKSTYAARLAAALGYIILAGSSRLAVATLSGATSTTFGPAWGRRQLSGVMSLLERERAHGPTNLDAALDGYARRAEPGLAVIITDLLTPEFEQGLRRLLDRRFEVTLLHLLAPEEVHPPMSGDLTLIDSENSSEVAITLNQEALDLYGTRFRAWTAGLESFCARHGIIYQRIQTSERLEHVLFDRLRRRGVLR